MMAQIAIISGSADRSWPDRRRRHNTGVYRATFDGVHLSDGVRFIVVVIGTVLGINAQCWNARHQQRANNGPQNGSNVVQPERRRAVYRLTLRSSVIGFFVGVLPGTPGRPSPAPLPYDREKLSGNSDSFGKGDIRGVAAQATNRLCLRLLHPDADAGRSQFRHYGGDDGALTLYNITPGPAMLRTAGYRLGDSSLHAADCERDAADHEYRSVCSLRMLTIPLWFWYPPSLPYRR